VKKYLMPKNAYFRIQNLNPIMMTTIPEIVRTESTNPDFKRLIEELDKDLYQRNGDAQLVYRPYNQVDHIKHVVVIEVDGAAVACGCFKNYDPQTIEIKRMFVMPEMRGRKLSALLLQELEKWAIEEGFSKAVLETGCRQVEAIGLYTSFGYVLTENYGQYIGMEDSICYRKELL
jgi:GNAT superfamily N-acetyltransferase